MYWSDGLNVKRAGHGSKGSVRKECLHQEPRTLARASDLHSYKDAVSGSQI
jgi:hypothetical protein